MTSKEMGDAERGYWKAKGLPYDREIKAMSDVNLAQELAKWETGSVPHRILTLEWARRRKPWYSTLVVRLVIPVIVAVVAAALVLWLGLEPAGRP